MPLQTQSLAQFVTNFINQFATETGLQPVLTSGDPVLALAQSEAAQAMFLQFQAAFTVAFARSTTATGPDLDSYYAQFVFPRTGSAYASGDVTLAVGSPAINQLVIPIDTIIQTVGGAIQYQLVPDTNQAAYNAGLQAYVLPAGQSAISATAQALVPGSASNVQPGQLIQFASSSANITSVTNNGPISNGTDSESDSAYRARFILYINSLSKGTYDAIVETCETVYETFTYAILSNVTPSNVATFGCFTVVVNNPGQTVSSGELATLQEAINSIRAFTIEFFVMAAEILTPPIAMNISILSGASFDTVGPVAQTAAIGYVNSLPSGTKLYLSDLMNAVINSSEDITSVDFTSITINGVQENFDVDQFHIVQANDLTVSIGLYDG